MYGYIYLTTNLTNGMKYIGQHKADKFDESYKGSGKILLQAMIKNGIDNFECRVIDAINNVPVWCETEDQLNDSEEFYISYYDCVNSNEYYNLVPGGRHRTIPNQIYVHTSDGLILKRISSEELVSYLDSGWMKGGKPRSSEATKKAALSNTGKKRTSEQKKHISDALKGVPLSEKHKASLRKPKSVANWKKDRISVYNPLTDKYEFVLKEEVESYLLNGYIKKGKMQPPDQGKKQSLAKKGRKMVNDGTKQFYVKKEELEQYLNQGYMLGSIKVD